MSTVIPALCVTLSTRWTADRVSTPSFRFVVGEVFQHRVLSGFVLKRLGTEFVERYQREHGVTATPTGWSPWSRPASRW